MWSSSIFHKHNLNDRWRENADIPGVAQVMSAAHGMTGHIGGGRQVQSLVNKLAWLPFKGIPVIVEFSFMAVNRLIVKVESLSWCYGL